MIMILSTEREPDASIPDWRRLWDLCITGEMTEFFSKLSYLIS